MNNKFMFKTIIILILVVLVLTGCASQLNENEITNICTSLANEVDFQLEEAKIDYTINKDDFLTACAGEIYGYLLEVEDIEFTLF